MSCLTHERNQPRIFCQIIRKPLKQNKIQHHAIKTMNIKSFLTWKLLYLFVVVVNLCHAILDDFWNPMNPIHLPKILKSSLKKSPQIQSFELLFLYSLQPLWPLPVIVFPKYPTFCSYTHFPTKKSQFPQKKIHPWKNISWPVPLTSFGPRFKRKKEKQILLITHRRSIIPTKPTLIIITPSCHIFFIVVKLNNYLFFMKGLFVLQLHTH